MYEIATSLKLLAMTGKSKDERAKMKEKLLQSLCNDGQIIKTA